MTKASAQSGWSKTQLHASTLMSSKIMTTNQSFLSGKWRCACQKPSRQLMKTRTKNSTLTSRQTFTARKSQIFPAMKATTHLFTVGTAHRNLESHGRRVVHHRWMAQQAPAQQVTLRGRVLAMHFQLMGRSRFQHLLISSSISLLG